MIFRRKNKRSEPNERAMAHAEFWGAQDYMVCCKGILCDEDEFNFQDNAGVGYIASLRIEAPGEEQGLFIHCFYSGHWSFAVSPSSEDSDELPDWPITREWGTVNQHSETLKIECPKTASVKLVEDLYLSS